MVLNQAKESARVSAYRLITVRRCNRGVCCGHCHEYKLVYRLLCGSVTEGPKLIISLNWHVELSIVMKAVSAYRCFVRSGVALDELFVFSANL